MKTDQSLAKITAEATISQIIAADEQAAELLASIGLSLSKHADETLRSVCQQHQWSEREVLNWVKKQRSTINGTAENKIETPPDGEASPVDWGRYLENVYINPNLELLKELDEAFPRLHKIHGNQYLWLKHIQWHFDKFEDALRMYYHFEKKKVFPLIARLVNSNRGNVNHGTIQKLLKSFAIVRRDQERLARLMKTIRRKGNHFENPEGACTTLRIQNKNFKILFSRLHKQFKVEGGQFIPRIKEEITARK